MKKLLTLAMLLVAATAQALPQNLPHHNRSDVATTVKQFIPFTEFHYISTQGVGVGDPFLAEVNSIGLVGIRMEATGDDAHVLIPLPSNMCVDCPVKFSVLWSTNSTTTTQTATWKVLYNEGGVGEALAAAASSPDTTITADSVLGTAYMLNETSQAVINSGTFDRNDVIHVLAELDDVSGLVPSSAVVILHGMYFEYTREKL